MFSSGLFFLLGSHVFPVNGTLNLNCSILNSKPTELGLKKAKHIYSFIPNCLKFYPGFLKVDWVLPAFSANHTWIWSLWTNLKPLEINPASRKFHLVSGFTTKIQYNFMKKSTNATQDGDDLCHQWNAMLIYYCTLVLIYVLKTWVKSIPCFVISTTMHIVFVGKIYILKLHKERY